MTIATKDLGKADKIGEAVAKFVRVDKPICADCLLVMHDNGRKGAMRYWKCPSCGVPQKTVERSI